MKRREVGIAMEPVASDEAPGLQLRRTIGSDKLVLLDPFLLLDHMSAGPEATREVGFPMHPHRGIETLTYVVAGRVHHEDTMGNTDAVGPGESQWMTAGSGLFHSEKVEVGDDGHEGFQLWLNLPAKKKMIPPAYRAARFADIPEVTTAEGATVRVIAGRFHDVTGPFDGILARPRILDVTLPPETKITIPAPAGQTAFAYVFSGAVCLGADDHGVPRIVSSVRLAIFTDGDVVTASAGNVGARFLFAAAKPLNEPVLQYRSLVMSTVDQMKVALDDLENGTFVAGAARE